ncbi:SAGA-associated factor 29 [Nilaparvata lugens]|uniref:SAGA-associated factor 29 n=1 Tax=Nilaparvata lugens TaxID=108931 RepID=UPI000B99CE74|nr:SAGA-associated factor 29 [Nilaparvata lugens]
MSSELDCQVLEKLKSLYKNIHEIEKERNNIENHLNNIMKTHEKVAQEGKVSPYYQQKLKSMYTNAVVSSSSEEEIIRQALSELYELRTICKEKRIEAQVAGDEDTTRRGDLLDMILSSALSFPLWVGKPGEKAPPLCGAIPADSSYIAKPGDWVAAFVKGDEKEIWMLAEVIMYNAATNKYKVDDIDEDQKERYVVCKRKVVPLPLMRANPETDPYALFPAGSVVMALYPRSTCFYKAVVKEPPLTPTDSYKLLFEDPTYADGYAPPLPVPQCHVIACKDKKLKLSKA